MPVILDSSEIKVIDGDKNFTIETVKSNVIVNQDTEINEPVVPILQLETTVSSETIDETYKYMAFTHSGGSEDQTEYSVKFNIETECDILIVGGGGGGANSDGGGGGGSGVILAESIILNGMYNIKVGKGGDGVSTDNGNNGKNSELEGIIALGGGGGRGWIAEVGHDGGSGGGGGGNNGSSPNTNGSSTQSKDKTTYGFLYTLTENGARLNIYGEDGGDGGINSASSDLYDALGGGGGGANQVGYSGTSINGANAGKGGDGINLSHIFGNTVGENGYFAGGGGGGSDGNIPTGLPGLGGGGQGYGQVNTPNINGKPNTGGGGGGGYRGTLSGSGGSGIVIIRYKVADATMEPQTLTHYTPERMYPPIHNFTSYSHLISGESYGNGVYEVSVSTNSGSQEGFQSFNDISNDIGWSGAGNEYSSTGMYIQSNYIVPGYLGDWIKIKLPRPIKLTRYGFKQRAGSYEVRAPGTYKIYGSNDGTNWDVLVHKRSKISYTQQISESNDYFEENINVNNQYQYFALVVNELMGSVILVNFHLWYIYGKEFISEEPEYKKLAFTYDAGDELVYDFTPYNDLTTWVNYANSLPGGSTNVSEFAMNGVFISGNTVGYFKLQLPTNYNSVEITVSNEYTQGLVNLYIDTLANIDTSTVKLSLSTGQSDTRIWEYANGDYLRIDETGVSVIGGNLKLVFKKSQTEYTVNFPEETECDILIVGGGGGGGNNTAGGGGAGGYYYSVSQLLTGSYSISVGKGGSGSVSGSVIGESGYNSSLIGNNFSITAIGGGGGASDSAETGGGGGSGGGADWNGTPGTDIDTNTDGNSGGTSINIAGQYYGSGGGGAGSAGLTNGDGGDGKLNSITGIDTYYAGGGGGGRNTGSGFSGLGGSGIGGNGGTTAYDVGKDAVINTGSGGGGGGGGNTNGGSGGSGIVIIRYKTQYQATTHGAQWTYHSANPNTHHYGNVGIGTVASATQKLLVNGDMNVTGNYKQNDNTIGNWYKGGTSIYRASGNVGIGNTDPRYSLHVHGGVYAGEGGTTGDGTTVWTSTSDSRMKDNIFKASYKECYDIFKKIELYRYNFKPGHVNSNDRNQLGFIAQEVQQQIPNSVEPRSIRLSSGVYIHDILTLNVTQINYILYGTFKYLIAELDIIKKHLESQEEAGQTE